MLYLHLWITTAEYHNFPTFGVSPLQLEIITIKSMKVYTLRSVGSGVQIQVGSGDISLLPKRTELAVGPTQSPIQGTRGIKRLGRATDTGSQGAGA